MAKPTAVVNTHKVKRDGNVYTASWKVPSNATKDGKKKATLQWVSWDIYVSVGKTSVKLTRGAFVSTSNTSSSININDFTTTNATPARYKNTRFTRDSFFPVGSMVVKKIDHNVQLCHSKSEKGPVATRTYTLEKPNVPSVGTWKFNTDTGTISCKVTAAKSSGAKERKSTSYHMTVRQMREEKNGALVYDSGWLSFNGGEKTVSYDCTKYQSLVDGDWYLVQVSANCTGLRGTSDTVTKHYVVGPPAVVTLKSNYSVSTGTNGRAVFPISTNRKKVKRKVGKKQEEFFYNPISGVIMQAARSVSAKSSTSVPGDAWEDIGTVDDGDCVALAVNSADITPSENMYTFIRVKSWRFDAECAPLCRYSNAQRVDELREVDTASDDELAILAVESVGANSIRVEIGFDKKSGGGTPDDADGTQLMWADRSTAWNSTDQPKSFNATWKNSTAKGSSESQETYESKWYYKYRNVWNYVQRIYVEGLEEGTKYWFRARRYNEDENGNVTYTSTYATKIWGTASQLPDDAAVATCVPVTAPTSVTLNAPQASAYGSDIQLTWTFDGGEQTAWRIYLNNTNKVVLRGTGASASCLLKSSVYNSYIRENSTIRARVSVCTSKAKNSFTMSDWQTIRIATKPVVRIMTSTVTEQPARFYLFSTENARTAQVVVTSRGCSANEAIKLREQGKGDDVWGASVSCDWTATTWGETEWYQDNVATVAAAADSAYEALDMQTESFVGGTSASIVNVTLEDDDGTEAITRNYVIVCPAGISESDDAPLSFVATMTVGSGSSAETWAVSQDPVWCDENGDITEGEMHSYLRLALPMLIDTEERIDEFVGSDITLTYLISDDGNVAAWDAYTELRAAADELTGLCVPTEQTYVATVEMPVGSDLRDGTTYDVSATVDGTSGLTSDVATEIFDVAWAHQAPKPGDGITVTPYDVTDEDGNRTIGATIKLAEPSGAAATDMADVWRVAADGWHRIAEGRGLTDTVVDQYAPFGDADLAYRVVVRTADGDTDYADYPYSLDRRIARFDFDGKCIELPYNLEVSHSYTKDSDLRQHIGEELPRGFWGSSHGRTVPIKADLVRSLSSDDRRLLHELGSYMGPVLVRTPDGCCMEAEVTSDHSFNRDPNVPVSLSVTEIELTEEHMARQEDGE